MGRTAFQPDWRRTPDGPITRAVSVTRQTVPRAFDRVARRYDLMTGMNPGYRRHLRMSAERLEAPADGRLLDLCCGTGLSTGALRAVYPGSAIVALDASAGMLGEARLKRELAADFVLGDATDPAAAGVEGAFDGILMAYGIRNVPERDRCLANLLELLKPGARIVFHEYSVQDDRVRRAIFTAVCAGFIEPAGWLTSRDASIYRYLRQSVTEFDGVGAFESRLRRAGFDGVRTLPLDGWQRGIVHSFVAQRPA